jgi:hypothetical protein
MWGSGGIVPSFLTSALDGGQWSASLSCCFNPGRRAPGTHWYLAGWASKSVRKLVLVFYEATEKKLELIYGAIYFTICLINDTVSNLSGTQW